MKISICIPQYNRIEYLKISLKTISYQKNVELEILISDDASTDDTSSQIAELQKDYPFPLHYFRFEKNQGYDRNLRKSLEMATGEYCFVLGNDDTLSDDEALSRLVKFLIENKKPDVGFCNSADYLNNNDVQARAKYSGIIGSGPKVALKYYSSFSFVAGIIYKKSAFEAVNTTKFDGSIYVQIYLATLIIIRGGNLFTFKEPLVIKDIRVNDDIANSYRETLPRKQSEYKILDAGLPSYAYVCATAFKDAGLNETFFYYKIIRRIYLFTYPFWLFDYRNLDARVAAKGLVKGLKLESFRNYQQFNTFKKIKLKSYYYLSTFCGLFLPVAVFNSLKKSLYKLAKA